MLVYSFLEDKFAVQEQSVELQNAGDVWIPAAIHRSRVEVKDGQRQEGDSAYRDIIWKTNLVNVEIPKSHFTVDSFRDGRPARILDWRTKGITKLEGQRPDKSPAAPETAANPRRSILTYILAAAVPLVLMALFSWRRLRRS